MIMWSNIEKIMLQKKCRVSKMDINVKKLLFSTHGRINRAQWWLGNFIVLISALALASIFM